MRAANTAPTLAFDARERLPVLLGLGATIALAWAYLLYMAWGMQHMDVGIDMLLMPRMTDWGPVDLALVFLMWAVMMVAMMLPSTLPMVMAFRSQPRHDTARSRAPCIVGFVAGYLMVWFGFSAAMTLIQWALLEARWISPMMDSRSPLFGGLLLVGAGAFQFTPLKQACLSTCRSPLSFLMTEWRPGVGGAWIMGLRHGLFCTGCCWLLMALLFVLGVMNVAWIAALTAFVLLEKTLPSARWISVASGVAFIAWGAWLVRSAAQAA
jgi:predicted metal-binding membrane protein